MNIVLAGGGTAGHINPLLATADALSRLGAHNIVAIGTSSGLETDLVPAAGYDLQLIPRVSFPRRLDKNALTFVPRFSQAVKEATRILTEHDAHVVVGFGGYASTPMYRGAKKLGIPVVVHEGNARPGLANRLGARFADVVALTFPSTPLKAAQGLTACTGLPLRTAISTLAKADRRQARLNGARRFGLDPERHTLVVTGGSSGAQHLNDAIAAMAHTLPMQVLHITGRGKDQAVRELAKNCPDYHVIDYVTDMENVYAVADAIITRSGAGMVAEVSALGIPAVFVPLPVGNGEQALNAHDVVAAGGALIVDNKDFTPQWVVDNVIPLFDDDCLSRMSAKARGVSPLDAADRLAELIIGLGGKTS